MKGFIPVVSAGLVMFIGLVIWVWFIEFGGWDFLLENSRHYPKLYRITNLLDHPTKYYQWRSSMKIFDILYWGYWYRPDNLKVYDLDIASTDFQKMNAYLPDSYTDGGLAQDRRIKVDGELTSEGVKHQIKVSYRGDTFNHWSGEKKSLKLEFNTGEEQNLIIPSDRGYFSESLSNYRAKKFGLLTQDDAWIWLRLNGRDIGVYYVTGGWNEYWLTISEKQISQLVGELDYQTGNEIFPNVWDGVWNWKYYAHRTNKKFPNSYYLQKFLDTVNNYNDKTFTQAIGEIMDIKMLISWKSISILMNSYHTDDFHNWRMWLNPKTLKFEIIPVDRSVGLTDRNPTNWPFVLDGGIDKLSSKIHGSADLSLAIDRMLWKYVKDDQQLLDDLKHWDILTKRILPQMYADRKKHFGNISLRKIFLMRKKITSQYENIRTYLTVEDLRLQVDDIENKPILIISSYQPTQVELISIIIDGQQIDLGEKLLFSSQTTTREADVFKFDRVPGMIKIPITCVVNCQIQVTGRNLVTGAIQKVSL